MKPKRIHRRATTLLETTVIIGVLAVVLAASAVAIGSMYRVDASVREQLDHSRTLQRLAQQFRDDAHRAVAAEASPGPGAAAALRFRFGDGRTVDYRLGDSRIERVAASPGQTAHREGFVMLQLRDLAGGDSAAGGGQIGWRVRKEQGALLALLTVPAAVAARKDGSLRTVEIEAAVGLDRRLIHEESSE